jgi:hypothetical protein
MGRKYKIEKSFYDKEVVDKDPKTGQPLTWPWEDHISFTAERAHKAFLDEVQDPITKQFYKKTDTVVDYDNDGKEIPESKKVIEEEIHYETNAIVRLRIADKKEFLYSKGRIYAYTALGNRRTEAFQEPEIWRQDLFKHKTKLSEKENRYITIPLGPEGHIIHYTLPFSPENVDKLMEYATPNITFYVKEEGKTQSKQCVDLEMFKTKPFDYILNDEWLTAEQREEAIKKYEALEKNIVSKRKAM